MSKAMHLNLLNPTERRSTSPVRLKVLMPFAAWLVFSFMLLWLAFVGIVCFFERSQLERVNRSIAALTPENARYEALKGRWQLLQAESDQYLAYVHGRRAYGQLLKGLAEAIPETITLTGLSIPPPPEQMLRPPVGSRLLPLQGPTQTVERVELRLSGIARSEQDLFAFMKAMKGDSFTGLVSVVEHPAPGETESPRVLEFRQDAPAQNDGRRDVFFDIVYALKPREFVK